jgi:hypothetical protein
MPPSIPIGKKNLKLPQEVRTHCIARLDSNIQVLSYIIAQPPLILPRRPLQRHHYILLVPLPSSIRSPTAHRLSPQTPGVSYTLCIALTPLLLLKPAPLALCTTRVFALSASISRSDRGGVLAGYERGIAGRRG